MAGLDDLRKRVEAAEQHFGLIATQSRKYSERLTSLVAQMEHSHAEQQREIAALNGRLGQYEQENGQLKSMLMGLLQAIENGSDRVIDVAVRDMEGRIDRLIGAQVPAVAVLAAVEAPEDDVTLEELADAADALTDDEAFEGEPAALARLPLPEPETVALDDVPEQGDSLTDSANDLLDRVEAAANALLAAGLDADTGEEASELTEEISALLESAIHGEPVVAVATTDEETAREDPTTENDDEMLALMAEFDSEPADEDAA
jgi:hypothetical protein